MPTIQETKTFMYHFATQALYQQGQKSDFEGVCCYRHPDGNLKCIIGHMIPDERYEPEMDGYISANDPLIVQAVFGTTEVPRGVVDFCLCLQEVHDCCEPHEWPEEFADLARCHGIAL